MTTQCEMPNCPEASQEFFEFNDDEGVNLCRPHYDAALSELSRPAAPSLTPRVATPILDALENR